MRLYRKWAERRGRSACGAATGRASRSRGHRRLAFERCEQRLPLSTATLTAPAGHQSLSADGEGGVIAINAARPPGDLAHVATIQPVIVNAFDVGHAEITLAEVRGAVLQRPATLAGEGMWRLYVGDAGLQVTDNAYAEFDAAAGPRGAGGSIDFANAGLNTTGALVDQIGVAAPVLPIHPAGSGPHSEGGPIAPAELARLAPLGLPAGESAALISDGAPDDRRDVEPAADGIERSIDRLRGRAVVYEVAGVPRSALGARGDASTGIASVDWPRDIATAVTATSTASVAGDARPAREGQSPARDNSVERHGQPAAALADAAPAGSTPAGTAEPHVAQADHAGLSDRRTVAIAAIDAAFADEADAAPDAGLATAPLGAFIDKHQRHFLGLAAALAVGAGPLVRFLRGRRQGDVVNQLPPRRRARWRLRR